MPSTSQPSRKRHAHRLLSAQFLIFVTFPRFRLPNLAIGRRIWPLHPVECLIWSSGPAADQMESLGKTEEGTCRPYNLTSLSI